jgi:outer membrane receptor protein involved in Fe transport
VFNFKQAAFAFGGITVSPAYEAAGFTNYDRLPGTIPDWRGQFFADYTLGEHNLRWTINYIDGADDNRGPTTVQTGPSTNCNVANAQAGTATNCRLTTLGLRVHSFVTHDLTYRWAMPNDLTISASVLNVLDEAPSKARLELSYDPFIGNPLGRTAKIGVKKKF